jgi:hypothetical protein
VEETKMSLEQVREHVVAAIYTLDADASTQQVFRAAEFGLNAQERQLREEGLDRFIENARVSDPQPQMSASAAPNQRQEPQSNPQGAV